MYNAIAQALQTMVQSEHPQKKVSDLADVREFKAQIETLKSEISDVYQQQEEILASIQKQPSPEEKKTAFETEAARIALLSPAEQKAIAESHKAALALAREEMGYAKANPTALDSAIDELSADRAPMP